MFFDQYGIHLGPLYLRFYGLIVVAAILAGTVLIERLAKARGMNAQFIWDSLIWTTGAGAGDVSSRSPARRKLSGLGRSHRARAGAWASCRPLGELCQPRTVRCADRFALGNIYSSKKEAGWLRTVR